MPVWIRRQLNDIHSIDARTNERFVIVSANAFLTIDKYLFVSELASRLPDNVLKPPYTRRITAQFQVLVTHHVEQDHRLAISSHTCQLDSSFALQNMHAGYPLTATLLATNPVLSFLST